MTNARRSFQPPTEKQLGEPVIVLHNVSKRYALGGSEDGTWVETSRSGSSASSIWSSASRRRCKRWWTSALPPIARCNRFSAASSSYCADRRVRLRRRGQSGCAAVRCPAEQEEARRRFSTYSAASTSLRQARCRSSAGSVLAQPRRGRSRLDTHGHAVSGQDRSHRASRG
jgi:hypothetical protein